MAATGVPSKPKEGLQKNIHVGSARFAFYLLSTLPKADLTEIREWLLNAFFPLQAFL